MKWESKKSLRQRIERQALNFANEVEAKVSGIIKEIKDEYKEYAKAEHYEVECKERWITSLQKEIKSWEDECGRLIEQNVELKKESLEKSALELLYHHNREDEK